MAGCGVSFIERLIKVDEFVRVRDGQRLESEEQGIGARA